MMVKVIPDKTGRLTQWDVDRKVLITGIDLDGAEIHFASPGDDHGAYVVEPKDNTADIPNILLTVAGTINVYIYPRNYTVFSAVLLVTPREKPDDYVYTETETVRYSTLAKQIGNLDDLTTTAKENLVAAINETAATAGGGKIDKITVNGVEQEIEDKTVDITVDKSTVGLESVDNTADLDKPVSTAVQAELDKKAPKETADEALEIATGATDAIITVRETAQTALERATDALPKSDVVAPDVSAQAGQAADAKATYQSIIDTQDGLSDIIGTLNDEVNDVRSTANTALEGKLGKAGGTMTGALTLSGAPTEDLHAATKKYVDDLPQTVEYKFRYSTADSKYHVDGLEDSSLYATFKSQIEAGKLLILVSSSGVRYYASVASGIYIRFRSVECHDSGASIRQEYISIKPSEGISEQTTVVMERTGNRVSDMTALTTNEAKYPSCKAVADYVAAKTKTYSAGTGIQISDAGVISLALENAEGGTY